MSGRAALSWALAALAAIAIAVGGLFLYASHVLFDSDAFGGRVAASLKTAPVRNAAAGRLTDAVLGLKPDLVALRPIVELGARGVVASGPFRALVRGAAIDAHRAAFDREQDSVAVRVRDAGILLAGAVRRLRPDAAPRIPPGVTVRVARSRAASTASCCRSPRRRTARGRWGRSRWRSASRSRSPRCS